MVDSIQSKGGKARAASLTKEQRSELAREAAEKRWEDMPPGGRRMPRATHAGTVTVGGVEIACAVLNDGRRVLTQDGFLNAIGRKGRITWGHKLETPPFLASEGLKDFVSEELKRNCSPVVFRPAMGNAGNKAYGFVADVLPEVCEAYLRARDAGTLASNQLHIARACDVLVRGLARVGIVALVDEATGFQRERNRDALHQILEAYIAKELLPWAKRFPDSFYKEMFRLRGWMFDPISKQGPRYAGKLTNKLVYQCLPPGVLAELQEKNPAENGRRKHRHHQFLTDEIGNPHLERHVAAVTTLMRASKDWDTFAGLFTRAFPKAGEQLDLDFPAEE